MKCIISSKSLQSARAAGLVVVLSVSSVIYYVVNLLHHGPLKRPTLILTYWIVDKVSRDTLCSGLIQSTSTSPLALTNAYSLGELSEGYCRD
jgi:hypothetical protein